MKIKLSTESSDTEKSFITSNETKIRFKFVDEFRVSNEREETLLHKCCEHMQYDTDNIVIITSDDCDDPSDLEFIMKKMFELYESNSSEMPNHKGSEFYSIVKMDGFRAIIVETSDDFIMILFKKHFLDKFLKQLLGYNKPRKNKKK